MPVINRTIALAVEYAYQMKPGEMFTTRDYKGKDVYMAILATSGFENGARFKKAELTGEVVVINMGTGVLTTVRGEYVIERYSEVVLGK